MGRASRARREAAGLVKTIAPRREKRHRPPPISIPCVGCGRISLVRRSKIDPCDGYLCAFGSCKLNPAFKIPPAPADQHVCLVYNAAGGFTGWRCEQDTLEHLAAVTRAKDLLERGLKRLREMN
jgi:hypothetical protein